ncbi:hypothetical protein ACFP81_09840 [Deinococcus lacus]|uniref:Uncharacterized protein n=1 Tax=Deinococcus lacus TaxID=392561 RepID=A0ABW1YD62_9DEIO
MARSLEAVRQALWLVDSKLSSEDAQAYRQMLSAVAERVAQAAKEGGFMGFGGEQVSAQEKVVIEQLGELLGRAGAGASPSPDGSGNAG